MTAGVARVRGPLALLMAAAFVDSMGAFLMLALLPFMGSELSPSTLGILVGAHAFAWTVASPLWGRWSDRYGRRPVLLGGTACSALAFVVFAVSTSPGGLLVGRLLQGLGSGVAAVVLTTLADLLPEDRRAQGIGWLTSATSIAAMLGPALGSAVTGIHRSAPSIALLAASCLLFVVIWRRLPESAGDPTVARTAAAPGATVLGVFRRPGAAPHRLIWLYCAGAFAWSAMTAVVTLHLAARFGVTERSVWVFFAYLGGLSVALRLGAVGPVVGRLGERRAMLLGALVFGAGLALLPWPSRVWPFALAVALVPVGTAWLFPAGTALLSRYGGARGGQLMGLQQAFGGVARMIGPVLAGVAFERHPALPFWFSGALVALCGSVAARAGAFSPAPRGPGGKKNEGGRPVRRRPPSGGSW